MRIIQKADIVGARIVEIYEACELSSESDYESSVIYFTVDRGFTFTTPYAGQAWITIELPANAKRCADEVVSDAFAVKHGWFGLMWFVRLPSTTIDTVKQIKLRRIAGVYCRKFDRSLGFQYPDDGIIVFDDGSQASNMVAAPNGTGGAGLYFFANDSGRCTPLDQLVDYFTIPLEDENTF
jgi:hypothetical protein